MEKVNISEKLNTFNEYWNPKIVGDINESYVKFFIIPRGIEHMPVAEEEVHVMLLEPKTTLNTGNVKNERTVEVLEKI